MPRKTLKGMAELCGARGAVDPGVYLLNRLKQYVAEEDHAKAEAIALRLMPYCRRTLAPEPVAEAKEAMQRAQLVIVPFDGGAGSSE